MEKQKLNRAGWLKTAFVALIACVSVPSAATSWGTCGCPDNTKPTAVCKNTTLYVDCTGTTLSASSVNNGSYDNAGGSGIASVTVSPSNFTCNDTGYKTVTLTVTDSAGNSATCCSTVKIVCKKPGCNITLSACSTPCGCPYGSSYTGSSYSTATSTAPYTIYLGYGPQCVQLNASAYGSNAFYPYCWTESSSNPMSGTLSCYTCASPQFKPTKPGLYTFTMTSYGSGSPANGCTPTPCAAVCTVTICVKDVQYHDDDEDDYATYEKNEDYGHSTGQNSNKKVYLCHVPPGNPSKAHTIYISVTR